MPDDTDTAMALRALGHPLRLRIAHMLHTGEKCVCEILSALEATQPNISQHLAVMKRAGIVKCYRKGAYVFYSLSSQEVNEIIRECRKLIGAPEPEPYIPMVDPCGTEAERR